MSLLEIYLRDIVLEIYSTILAIIAAPTALASLHLKMVPKFLLSPLKGAEARQEGLIGPNGL